MKKFATPLSLALLLLVAVLVNGCSMVLSVAAFWMDYTRESSYVDVDPAGGWVDPEWTGVPGKVAVLYAEPLFDGYASFKQEWPEYGGNFNGWFFRRMKEASKTLAARAEVERVEDTLFAMVKRDVLWKSRDYKSRVQSVEVPVLRNANMDSLEDVVIAINPVVVAAEERGNDSCEKSIRALYSVVEVKSGKMLAYGVVKAAGEMGHFARESLSEVLLKEIVKGSPLETVPMSPRENPVSNEPKKKSWNYEQNNSSVWKE